MNAALQVRRFEGLQDYETLWHAMQRFTRERQPDTPDELWVLQHKPVYTLGQAGKAEHLLVPSAIPVIKTDRGGQITYHGPGQLVIYLLIDLKRRRLGVRQLVRLMEQAIIGVLQHEAIAAYGKTAAPGVYVNHRGLEHKIASLGLRVRNGCCYHGLAFNIDMDLKPFHDINPCGYAGLPVTQLVDILQKPVDWPATENTLVKRLQQELP